MKVKINKLNDDVKLPIRAHYNDSGADIFAPHDFIILAGWVLDVPLGFSVELPDGYDIMIESKSSLNRRGITVFNSPVDSGYRGELHALLYNSTNESIIINQGEKIGQLVCRPVIYVDYVEVLGEERKDGAFGSTGK